MVKLKELKPGDYFKFNNELSVKKYSQSGKVNTSDCECFSLETYLIFYLHELSDVKLVHVELTVLD